MANILVINPLAPFPANYNGNTVRVFPLSCELAKRHTCFLATFDTENERVSALRAEGLYRDILLLPPPEGSARRLRHLYPLSGNRPRVQRPAYYRKIKDTIRRFCEDNGIDLVLVHTLGASEFADNSVGVPVILDDIDCRTLSVRRRKAYLEASGIGMWDRLAILHEYLRARYQESGLGRRFELVTTVSPVDRQQLVALNRDFASRIVEIPNGVTPGLLEYDLPEEERRSIAFWGALDFPPNHSAVIYFYERVYKPYLKDTDIQWYIVGRNPGSEIRAMSQRHENIVVTGFVDDLFALVSRIPIMINTMQMGGGLKNKVLEAFALGRLVVSNAMGMEAIPACEGVHYVQADTPRHIADQILKYIDDVELRAQIGIAARKFVSQHYSWDVIGKRFCELVDSVIDPCDRETGLECSQER